MPPSTLKRAKVCPDRTLRLWKIHSAQAALGWLPDYTGTISFDDVDIHTITPAQLQQQMSYIEQNVFLFNTTIRENITLGEDFSEEQLHAAIQAVPCRRFGRHARWP